MQASFAVTFHECSHMYRQLWQHDWLCNSQINTVQEPWIDCLLLKKSIIVWLQAPYPHHQARDWAIRLTVHCSVWTLDLNNSWLQSAMAHQIRQIDQLLGGVVDLLHIGLLTAINFLEARSYRDRQPNFNVMSISGTKTIIQGSWNSCHFNFGMLSGIKCDTQINAYPYP